MAQLVAHLAFNQGVAGSIPVGGTSKLITKIIVHPAINVIKDESSLTITKDRFPSGFCLFQRIRDKTTIPLNSEHFARNAKCCNCQKLSHKRSLKSITKKSPSVFRVKSKSS